MKALVTGGGGFVGGEIVRQLLQAGVTVSSLARGYHPELEALGVTQLRGDIADSGAVTTAVRGHQTVYHTAAMASTWGPYRSFFQSNVIGTQNVIDACRTLGVKQLIYTSSPSVVFDGSDMEGVDESVPYPSQYHAHYPQTKAEAERRVLAANGPDLQTVALRPHLVWGPRDTHLVPRIVKRARAGQLRRIGSQKKMVDTTYIEDAARAHLLAAEGLQRGGEVAAKIAGNAYFITAGQPVETWDMVNRFLQAAGVAPITGVVPKKFAYAAGWYFEKTHQLLGKSEEPRMTRWVVQELATAHWFDISAAKKDLAYQPAVGIEEGLERLSKWFAQHPA